MENIEQKAIHTYQNNLKYFKQNHQDLYTKLELLSTLIQEGKYQEKYVLDYKDEGYFDVLEVQSKEYLYKTNSYKHTQTVKDTVDKKRTGSMFKAFKYFCATDEQAEEIDKSKLSFHNYLWASIKVMKYTQKHANPNTYMNVVYKSMFIGTGLGLHISDIIAKLGSQVIFIQEKNLELFRLSLFVTDYAKIAENCTLFFSVLENEEVEQKIFLNFLNMGNNYNLHIKYIPFDTSYTEILQQFQRYVFSQSFIHYGYSARLFRDISSPKYLVQNYNFLNTSIQQHIDNIFADKPILLLFSGPSTSNNIKWLKENHEKFIIISPLSACKLLSKYNIKPDILIHIDPSEKTKLLFEDLDTEEYFKNMQIILAAHVTENTIKRFKKSQINIIEQGTSYKKDFKCFIAPSVGEYTYALSLIFQAKNIYMLGIDLALDKHTLQTHTGEFHFHQVQGKEDKSSTSLDTITSIHYIKGNLTDEVPTSPAYELSINQFNNFTKEYKNNTQNVYNLSDGAYLEGTIPLQLDEFDWNQLSKINKVTLPLSISTFFRNIGSTEFRDIDREILEYQLNEAIILKEKIIAYQKITQQNLSTFLNSLSTLSWELSDMEDKTKSDLARVYYEYFQTIISYIFDLFNTQKLKDENNHILEINKILITQLLKISDIYIDTMQKYLKI